MPDRTVRTLAALRRGRGSGKGSRARLGYGGACSSPPDVVSRSLITWASESRAAEWAGMTDQDEPRRLTGEAAWKAHLNDVDRRNSDAKKKAAVDRSAAELAALARARELKGD